MNKFSKATLNALKDLNVKVDFTNRTIVQESRQLNLEKKEETIQGSYKVTVTEGGQFRILDQKELVNGITFEGDTFDLIGEDFVYIEGDLYRKAKIITSWLPMMINRIGWIRVKSTDAPMEAPVRQLFSGKFRLLSNNVQIRDCHELDIIECGLNNGDSVDFVEFNECIALKNSILRKVIIKDCHNKELINKTVWMKLLELKDSNSLFKIKKEIPLIKSLKDNHGYKLYEGDVFELTDTPIQFIGGSIYKQVKIVSSKDINLNKRVGWIDIRFTTALTTTVKLVEEQFRKDNNTSLIDEKVPYERVRANRDILAFIPDKNDGIFDNTIVIDKGTVFNLFDKFDSHGRRYVEISEVGDDNISRVRQYTIKL